MKILFIAPLPPPVHGSAMVSQYIKDSRLVNELHDCDFVNLSTSRRMDEIGKGGIKKLLRFVGAYFAVFFKLLTRRYDLCYLAITCHDKGFLKDAPFVLLCKLFGRKVLIHQHNKGMSGCVHRWPYRWLLPLVYRNTKVMLLSWHLYDDIAQVVKREQVVICANGVPPLQAVGHWPLAVGSSEDDNVDDNENDDHTTQELSHADFTDCTEDSCLAGNINLTQNTQNSQNGKSLRPCTSGVSAINDDDNVDDNENDDDNDNSQAPTANGQQLKASLLFLSNLIESKGVYVLLDACKVLKERGLSFVCDFVGGETKEISAEVFREAVATRGLEDYVTYHGPQYGEDKHRFFMNADVFVFPTYYYNECFPLVLLEAMQWRLPLVSSDEGGIPDIIQHGVNGFVAERKDVMALANALEQLITDPTLRRQMGEAGYARYKELYTLEAFEKCFVAQLATESRC